MLSTERRKSLSGVDAHVEIAARNERITASLRDDGKRCPRTSYRLIAGRTARRTGRTGELNHANYDDGRDRLPYVYALREGARAQNFAVDCGAVA